MQKIIYIIPALGSTCNEAPYKKLTLALEAMGYFVKHLNPNWYQPLSEQVVEVEKDATVFGFSFGAVLAYLIAKKFPFKKAIFASISPIHTFSFKSLEKDFKKHMKQDLATKIARDIKSIKISLNNISTPFITLAGQFEKKIPADFIVPKTGHRLNSNYINCIKKLL